MRAGIAGLGKDKQAAADAMTTALTNEKRTALRLQNAEGYNKIQKSTVNTYAGSPAGGEQAWASRPLTESEAKNHLYGRVISQSMAEVGDIALSRETMKQINSNIAQLKDGPPSGIVANWLKTHDYSPLPDDLLRE